MTVFIVPSIRRLRALDGGSTLSGRGHDLLRTRHSESRGDARERGRIAHARARELLREQRAECGDRARAAGGDDLSDVLRNDTGLREDRVEQRLGIREQRRDQSVEASTSDARVDVDGGAVVREDRRGAARKLDLRRVRADEDLVAELQLYRVAQRRELAL